jgi:hypothetical protein
MPEDTETSEGVIEVVVLLLDLRLKTEDLFPECIDPWASGDGSSPYEEVSED